MRESTTRRATLNDVADYAKVSLKTASRVLNGVTTVAPDLRDRVLEAATSLHYRPHRGAATMRSGHSDMIGMVIRDLENPFYSALAVGAAEVSEANGCLLITSSSEGSLQRQQQLLEAVLAQRPAGIIITPAPGEDELLRSERDRSLPIVAVDEALSFEADTVTFDNFGGAFSAVKLAIEGGHRRFGVISESLAIGTMPQRVEGALSALRAHQLGYHPELVVQNVHTYGQARTAARALLQSTDPPDVLFCANNVAAVGAAAEIHRCGASTTLVSFDDFPLSDALGFPTIVVSHDTRQMGREASRLLFSRIAEPDLPPRHITVPTELHQYRQEVRHDNT